MNRSKAAITILCSGTLVLPVVLVVAALINAALGNKPTLATPESHVEHSRLYYARP